MSIAGSLVVFAVLWFLSLFVVLPLGIKPQDPTKITPGTNGAPQNPNIRRKLKITTVAACFAFVIVFIIIQKRVITLDSFDIIYGDLGK